jgi:transcriptional regulator with XRE-family HTH domain
MNTNLNSKQIGKIIQMLRKEKSISQETLSKALDIPRPSISQIENGNRELSFSEFQKLLHLLEISYEQFVELTQKPTDNQKFKTSKINKKIKFNSEKFEQLLLYILQKCGSSPNVGETVLYKLLYFCDFDFFEIFESPLTGMKYKRMQYGPVPDQKLFNPIIKDMRFNGWIERVTQPYKHDTIQTRYLNFIEADLSAFGSDLEKVLKVADSVISKFSHLSARQIEDHVHKDYPWQSHKNGEEIDYGSVFQRTGEFAQRDYDMEFLNASNEDAFGSLPPITKEEYDYYMSLPDKK